jgi:hypothetical protein
MSINELKIIEFNFASLSNSQTTIINDANSIELLDIKIKFKKIIELFFCNHNNSFEINSQYRNKEEFLINKQLAKDDFIINKFSIYDYIKSEYLSQYGLSQLPEQKEIIFNKETTNFMSLLDFKYVDKSLKLSEIYYFIYKHYKYKKASHVRLKLRVNCFSSVLNTHICFVFNFLTEIPVNIKKMFKIKNEKKYKNLNGSKDYDESSDSDETDSDDFDNFSESDKSGESEESTESDESRESTESDESEFSLEKTIKLKVKELKELKELKKLQNFNKNTMKNEKDNNNENIVYSNYINYVKNKDNIDNSEISDSLSVISDSSLPLTDTSSVISDSSLPLTDTSSVISESSFDNINNE